MISQLGFGKLSEGCTCHGLDKAVAVWYNKDAAGRGKLLSALIIKKGGSVVSEDTISLFDEIYFAVTLENGKAKVLCHGFDASDVYMKGLEKIATAKKKRSGPRPLWVGTRDELISRVGAIMRRGIKDYLTSGKVCLVRLPEIEADS